MIEAMNEGKIRVLFGSTEMLGTGVNAQKRCVAIHHLDAPWRPSDLQQRNGRGIRKGNEVAKLYADNKVDVIIYAVEKSLDSYKFNLLYNKQLFITQLKQNNMGCRTIDEGAWTRREAYPSPSTWRCSQGIPTCSTRHGWRNGLPAWKASAKPSNGQGGVTHQAGNLLGEPGKQR